MILRFIKNSPLTQSGRYSFASAAAAIDYYSLLGV